MPIFIIFSFLLLATSATWFFLSRPDDSQVVGLTLRNIAHLETFEYRGALSLAADRSKDTTAPLFDAVFYNNGRLAMNAHERPDIINNFEARLYFPEGKYGFRGNFTRANEATYLKLDESPSFGLLNLADVVGKWFTVPALWDTGPVTREIRPLTGMIGQGDVFRSITRLADEEIEGRAVYHLQTKIAPAAFEDFVRSAVLGQGGNAGEAEAAVVFVRSNITIDTLDLWVTKRGFDLYRMRALGDARLSRFAPAHFIASVDLRRHNHALTIAPPAATTTSIETVLAPIGAKFGIAGFETRTLTSQLPALPSIGGTQVTLDGMAAFSADTDRDRLSNLMEQVYGTDPLNPDSDADGYWDGDEVERGYDPMGSGNLR